MQCDNTSLCHDKTSTHYFMCHMSQKEYESLRPHSELKVKREARFQWNKIKYKQLQKMDESL